MNVEQLMSSHVATCDPGNTLQQAARLMVQYDCGMIPVVRGNGQPRIVGTITDRDIACRAVAVGADPTQTMVEDVMSPAPVTIRFDEPVEEAERLMQQHQIRRLIVLDDQGRCCGVLAQADIARHESQRETGRLVRAISEPGSESMSI